MNRYVCTIYLCIIALHILTLTLNCYEFIKCAVQFINCANLQNTPNMSSTGGYLGTRFRVSSLIPRLHCPTACTHNVV